jgi:hypothetical protein
MLPITQDSSCCMRRICQAAMLCFHRVLDAPLIAWSARTREDRPFHLWSPRSTLGRGSAFD